MNRRDFVGKAAGVSALAAISGKVDADVVEPGPEICHLRHTKEDGPPCIRIKVLSVTRVGDVANTTADDRPGVMWQCEYELTRIDGSTAIRTASTTRLGSEKQPNSFGFDLS